MDFLNEIRERLFRSSEHLMRANQALLGRLDKAFVPPDTPLVTLGALVEGEYLNTLLARYYEVSREKIKLDDTLYDVPSGTFIWEKLYEWLFPVISVRYRQPNYGTDCDDLPDRAEQFFRHFWPTLDSYAIGSATVVLPGGTRHRTSFVLWTNKEEEIEAGFMEFSPQGIFYEPPPLGIFKLEQTNWKLEEITI